MKLVYIASPLRGDIEGNIQKAVEYSQFAAEQGVVPLAPHTIFTQYLDDTDPKQRELGLLMGQELLKRCDEMWVFGQELSEGMTAEILLADDYDIPMVRYRDIHSQPSRTHKYSLKIERDEEPPNPRDDENLGTMVCWHRRYNLGDKHDFDSQTDFFSDVVNSEFTGAELYQLTKEGRFNNLRLSESKQGFEKLEYMDGDTGVWSFGIEICTTEPMDLNGIFKDIVVEEMTVTDLRSLAHTKAVILPINLYDHSVLSVSTGSFVGLAQHAEWGSGQVGYICATHEKIKQEYGEITDESIARATDALNAEINLYDCYLNNECYGFTIKDYEDTVDSCWGFMGNYNEAVAAMREQVVEEYQHLFDEEQAEEWEHD